MNTNTVYILQDYAHLWGLMALHSLTAFGAACSLVSATDIAHGALLRKPPKTLLVPGGSARQKHLALGQAGIHAIRSWIAAGGSYIGICGGAGLGLAQGLGLCQWQRRSFATREAHLLSGHVLADCAGELIPLPVWWPARFEPKQDGTQIIATYKMPGDDLWLADQPPYCRTGLGPCETAFPANQPLAVRGQFGNGSYVLSYAHPETPASEAANVWLCRLLRDFGVTARACAAPWPTLAALCQNSPAALAAPMRGMEKLVRTGLELGLLYPREPWLLGWRKGAPGIALNNLIACLAWQAGNDLESSRSWQQERHKFNELFDRFIGEAEQFLRDYAIDKPGQMNARRDRIFGHPMLGGGMADELLAWLEIFRLETQESDQAPQ